MSLIEKALKHRVVLLSGEEEALRRRALHELLHAEALALDAFDLQEFEGGTDPQEWVGSASTAPFMGERRVAVVRHVLRGDAEKATCLQTLPASGLVLLVADEEAGDESKQQRLKTAKKHWEKVVDKAGGWVEKFATDPRKAQSTLKDDATRLGKELSPKAMQTLVEMTGGSLSRALEELEKLALFVGEERRISESDVQQIVVPAREWNVFRMIDAIVRGDAGEALTQLRILIGSPGKAEEAAFRSIFPLLSRQFRLLWQARICVEARVSPAQAPPEIALAFPDKPNLAKEQPYRQTALMTSAKRLTFAQLTRCFESLRDADARLKGLLPAYGTHETLEQMVLEMASVSRPALH